MGLVKWLRPPGRTLAVFLCLMLFLGGTLGWLGWRLLEQDRALEKQRLQERLELAADGMAAALEQSLADLENHLGFIPSPGAKELPDGVLALQATERTVNVFPPGVLLYSPVIPDGEEPPEATFTAGVQEKRSGQGGRSLSPACPITKSRRARWGFAAFGPEPPQDRPL